MINCVLVSHYIRLFSSLKIPQIIRYLNCNLLTPITAVKGAFINSPKMTISNPLDQFNLIIGYKFVFRHSAAFGFTFQPT